MVMDSTDSCSEYQHPQLPPGFRFHPTDEELLVHYLKRKAASAPLPVAIIADIDLYKFDPWELPSKAAFGEQEWYFFSPRDRKYPNGARPNRAATSGYWKATGTDKPILSSDGRNQKVGVKKALVFYCGKPPKGVKTNWIMHEYRLTDNNNSYNNNSIPNPPPPSSDPASQSTKKNSLRLDNWVLCRIYKKSNSSSNMDTGLQRPGLMEQEREICMEAMIPTISSLSMANNGLEINNDGNLFDGILGIGGRGSGGGGGGGGYGGGGGGEESHHDHYHHHHLLPTNSSIKRPLASAFWNETAGSPSGSSSSSKRFHGDLNSSSGMSTASADENSSFISLLSQIPTHHHQNTTPFLGSVGDSVLRQQFQLPSINWTS